MHFKTQWLAFMHVFGAIHTMEKALYAFWKRNENAPSAEFGFKYFTQKALRAHSSVCKFLALRFLYHNNKKQKQKISFLD